MLAAFDEEIGCLDFRQQCTLYAQIDRMNLARQSAMVPTSSDRLARYASHLSEEFDRLLTQLERLQRGRLQRNSDFKL